MRVRTLNFLLAILTLSALSAVFAAGQAIDGNVLGTVVDGSGAAIVGADMTLTNVETTVTVSAKTGATVNTVSITCWLVPTGLRQR